MEEELAEELRARGSELTERHDEETIAEVIEDVEALEDEDSEQTAEVLRTMTGIGG